VAESRHDEHPTTNPLRCPLCGGPLAFSCDCRRIGCNACQVVTDTQIGDGGVTLPIVMAEKPGPAELRLDILRCKVTPDDDGSDDNPSS